MKNSGFFKAALLGLAVAFGPFAVAVQAENITVLRKGVGRDLNIAMNRAVVVESDTPFAELSIANPSIADFSTLSDRTIYVLGKTPGRTTLTLLDATGRLISNVEVHVTPDVSEFKERLRQIIPNEKIEVRSANDGIVLSGSVSSMARMTRALELAERYAPERVSNLMVVSGQQQVMLKVRFAEMQRSVSKSLGVSTQMSNDSGSVLFGADTGAFAPTRGVLNGAMGSLGLSFDLGSVQVGMLLEALEEKGVVRTLAEPNLTALSGQEAKFLAGGEFPIPVDSGDDGIEVEFKPFGVELNFIPRVVDDGIINLEMAAAVSSIDTTNSISIGLIELPAFKRRDSSTTVAMRDGQSFAIAGLLQDDFRDNNSQVPWIGDIPILGTLFRSADYQRSQTELVIIVTAHLVSPTSGEALALPTDRVKLPTEKDLFLNGRVAKNAKENSGSAGEVAKQDFTGSYGYVME